MKTQFVKAGGAVEKGETLALRLERSRRELEVCHRQLAQMNDLFDAHKRSEALLQGEKNQEALSNTLKYARAKQFRTRLTANAKELRLELCDDGDGFQVRKRHDGVGLIGMRERAEEMGGEFKIVSSRGKGTKITVILPRGAGRQPAVQPKLARPSTGMGMEAAL
jgi:signal transduction histidine kinase